jgi:hypothetical protein
MIDRNVLTQLFTKPLRADDEDLDDEDDLEDDDEGDEDDEDEEVEDGDEPETWQVSARGPSSAKGCLLLDFG